MRSISPAEVTPRTIVGWWDGMISGLAEMAGRPIWLQLNHATEADDVREYWVYPLTAEESDHEWAKHRLFERVVGSHWCMQERCGTPNADFPGNPENFLDFYEEYPPQEQPDYTDREPVGSVRLHVPRNAAARDHLG